jgi:hypothetical protein
VKKSRLLDTIKEAVHQGKIIEPFKSSDVPCLLKSPSFLSKHAQGNGKNNEYFVRVGRGLYKLKQ